MACRNQELPLAWWAVRVSISPPWYEKSGQSEACEFGRPHRNPVALPAGWALVNGCLVGPHAELDAVNLAGANLTGIDLSLASMISANLANAVLINDNLANANLAEADLASADLTNANMTNVALDSPT